MILLEKINFRINKLLKSNPSIPDILTKRKLIENYIINFKPSIFVETGTFLGDTIDHFKGQFQFLYSIELSDVLAEKAVKRFEGNAKIKIIQGNSAEVLPSVLNQLSGTVLFWLDGHYSSEFFVKDEFIKTAKGETNTPVVTELEIILGSPLKSIILVDDARLFNGKDDYPTIKEIKSIVRMSGKPYNTIVSCDIIQIIPAQ